MYVDDVVKDMVCFWYFRVIGIVLIVIVGCKFDWFCFVELFKFYVVGGVVGYDFGNCFLFLIE